MFHVGHNEKHIRGYVQSLSENRLTSITPSEELVDNLRLALEQAGSATGKPMSLERFTRLQHLLLRVADLIDLQGTEGDCGNFVEDASLDPSTSALRRRRRLTTDCALIANVIISPAERLDFSGWLFATSTLHDHATDAPAGAVGMSLLPVYQVGAGSTTVAEPQILPGLILRNGGHVDHSVDHAKDSAVKLVEKAIYQAGVQRLKSAMADAPSANGWLDQAIGQLKTA